MNKKIDDTLLPAEYSEAFGHLELVPEHKRQRITIYRKDCYICNDPDYRLYGLPLCYQCPRCKGHIAADDTICDDCGYEVAEGPDEEPGQGIKCQECDSWTWSGMSNCRNCHANISERTSDDN